MNSDFSRNGLGIPDSFGDDLVTNVDDLSNCIEYDPLDQTSPLLNRMVTPPTQSTQYWTYLPESPRTEIANCESIQHSSAENQYINLSPSGYTSVPALFGFTVNNDETKNSPTNESMNNEFPSSVNPYNITRVNDFEKQHVNMSPRQHSKMDVMETDLRKESSAAALESECMNANKKSSKTPRVAKFSVRQKDSESKGRKKKKITTFHHSQPRVVKKTHDDTKKAKHIHEAIEVIVLPPLQTRYITPKIPNVLRKNKNDKNCDDSTPLSFEIENVEHEQSKVSERKSNQKQQLTTIAGHEDAVLEHTIVLETSIAGNYITGFSSNSSTIATTMDDILKNVDHNIDVRQPAATVNCTLPKHQQSEEILEKDSQCSSKKLIQSTTTKKNKKQQQSATTSAECDTTVRQSTAKVNMSLSVSPTIAVLHANKCNPKSLPLILCMGSSSDECDEKKCDENTSNLNKIRVAKSIKCQDCNKMFKRDRSLKIHSKRCPFRPSLLPHTKTDDTANNHTNSENINQSLTSKSKANVYLSNGPVTRSKSRKNTH